MELNFVKMNPAGNTTIFIFDQLSHSIHGKVAQYLMKSDCLCADQVAFIEKPESPSATARLQMMGGEFCGNALRALAALLFLKGYPNIYKPGEIETDFSDNRCDYAIVPLEISSYNGIIKVEVKVIDGINRIFWSKAPVPVPLKINKVNFDLVCLKLTEEGTVVEFPGITHVVFKDMAPEKKIAFDVQKQLRVMDAGTDALGIMFYQSNQETMTPLVYVRASDSLVWEGSCGSGSVAVAAAIAMDKKENIRCLKLKQPGGEIEVDIDYIDEKINKAIIQGLVSFVSEGKVYLPDLL
jgi:diaminopimelate epimerase